MIAIWRQQSIWAIQSEIDICYGWTQKPQNKFGHYPNSSYCRNIRIWFLYFRHSFKKKMATFIQENFLLRIGLAQELWFLVNIDKKYKRLTFSFILKSYIYIFKKSNTVILILTYLSLKVINYLLLNTKNIAQQCS